MASHYPSYYEDATHYPFVGTVSIGKKDRVDFLYQFVKEPVYPFLMDIHEINFYKDIKCICGPPSNFPNYGDFPETFVMVIRVSSMKKQCANLQFVDLLLQTNHGSDISLSPWQEEARIDYVPHYDRSGHNNLDIEFHEAVYPIRVSIYEIYNPGSIIQIWTRDPYNRWFLLWNGLPQSVPSKSRLFSPPLQSCNFKINMLRLTFKHSVWNYYTKLDAVMLIGTSQLILSKNLEEHLTNLLKRINCQYPYLEDTHNLTADYTDGIEDAHFDIDYLQKNFLNYCIIHKSDTLRNSFITKYDENVFRVPDYMQLIKQDESEKRSHGNLSALSDSIILKILKQLDIKSLCSMSKVNRRFNNLTRNPLLYTHLSMRNISDVDPKIFSYFIPRCSKYLKTIDLTFSNFDVTEFIKFISKCGKHLTHLRLSECECINNVVLAKISKICKNLKELDVRYCEDIDDMGFSYLQNLRKLEHLRVGHTRIEADTFCKILKKNPRMRELNLEFLNLNLDAVPIALNNSCQHQEEINLEFVFNVTLESINALSNCTNLRSMNVLIVNTMDDNSLHKLRSSCQHPTIFFFQSLSGPPMWASVVDSSIDPARNNLSNRRR